MSQVGQKERATQNRVVNLFSDTLGYEYLGNWEKRSKNSNIEPEILLNWLQKQGTDPTLANRAITQLDKTATDLSKTLYDRNREVYNLLRYGIKVKPEIGENYLTVWVIDWQHPENNHFAIAEEVTVKGANTKRPDLVLYINGIPLGIIELKSSTNDLAKAYFSRYLLILE